MKNNQTVDKLNLLQTKYCVSSLSKFKLKNKKIILRIDADVPIRNGNIIDDTRLQRALPTISFLLKHNVKRITLIAHLGRPKGIDESLSLGIIAQRLAVLLKKKVLFVKSHDIVDLNNAPKNEQTLQIILLENVRFNDGEQKNSLIFAKKIAQFGSIYVNDAFATAHRSHASTHALTKVLPSYTGLLIQKEIKELGNIVIAPKKPFTVLVGFAKISDKISILTTLLEHADHVLIGGAVAQTFLLAQGREIGRSLIERDQVPLAKELLDKYAQKIILPIDVICAKTVFAKTQTICTSSNIPRDLAVFDIGPKTANLFFTYLKQSKSVFWNGPMGVFEIPPYNKETNVLIKKLAKAKTRVVIGGGDTANAINKTPYAKNMAHISTGGGASLSFIKNPILPAFTAILNSHKK